MTRKVELEPAEWGQVMQIISTAPWNVANPLLMKIAGQLREQDGGVGAGLPFAQATLPTGNSGGDSDRHR
jgi:hypothetical protein